jgi:O-antigen ligase
MPPGLASLLTIVAIWYLFRLEKKNHPEHSSDLWVPFWWLLIGCSREVSQWLDIFGIPVPVGTLEEGNPVNRLFYLTCIVLGLRILAKRNIRWGDVFSLNLALTLFLGYSLLSVAWSDYPFISLKRWIKVIGHPIMALVVLTEPNPGRAVLALIRRCAYVLVPVSILFIKYYPQWGRGFSPWTGASYNTGITEDKNMLGINILIVGFFGFCDLAQRWAKGDLRMTNREVVGLLLIGLGNLWLLTKADSKTPLVCLTAAVAVFTFLSWRGVNSRNVTIYFVAAAILCGVLQWSVNIYERILLMLGRDPTLTDRTEVWKSILDIEINPVFGTGFESFWLGQRLETLWDLWAFRPNQAHNGYLETYINLGILGFTLLLAVLTATWFKSCRELHNNREWGRIRTAMFVAILLYNWTEAAFKTTHPIFFVFYLIAMDAMAIKAKNLYPGRSEVL